MAQVSKKITEKRTKWCGHVTRMKEEHDFTVRRMPEVYITGNRRRGRSNLRGKDASKRYRGGAIIITIIKLYYRLAVTHMRRQI